MDGDMISVVIAVYNAVSYLQRSVESVLNQTYRNIEILLIDDGSTDGSDVLCDELAARDARVTVIHKQNEGLSVARNVALKCATGKYLSFIDSDDELRQDAYARSVQVMTETQADFIKYDYCIDKEDFFKKHAEHAVVEPVKQVVDKILRDEYGSQLWQYLFKRELWDGIISPSGRLAQDMMTLHIAVARANRAAILHENLYYYFQTRMDNVSNGNKKNIRGTADRAYAYWIRSDFCKKDTEYTGMRAFCINKAVEYTVSCFCRREFIQEQRYSQDRMLFRNNMILNKSEILENQQIDLLKKICMRIILLDERILSRLYLLRNT